MHNDKFVGSLIRIDRDNFKAFALIIKLDESTESHEVFYECLVIQSNQYEYENNPIFVKENTLENSFANSWHIVSN